MNVSRSPERTTGGRIRKTSVGRGSGSDGIASGSQGIGHNQTLPSSSARFTSSSTAAAPSGLSAARRAHHILGGEDRIVLDIGARVTKAGHCGEARPRSVQNSVELATHAECDQDETHNGILFTLDASNHRDEADYRVKSSLLRSRMKLLLRSVLHRVLVQDTKQRKVIVVENVFTPTLVKDAIREALFDNLQVASVAFAPTSVMSAVAIGRSTLLTLDIGFEQSTLVPVHFWRPMLHRHLFTTTRAAKRLSARLKALLIKFGSFIPPPLTDRTSASSNSTFAYMQSLGNNSRARRKDIPQEILDEDFLDEIKAKALLVMNAPPKQAQVETLSTADRFETQGYSDDTDEDHNVEWMKSLEASYRAECEVKDMVIAVPPKRRATMTPPSQPSTLGAGPIHHLQDRRGSIVIPGWIRAYAIEVLFEQGDNDSPSLTEVILDCLLRLPVDLRFIMARNIYLTGGTAMIAGLAHRLRLELVRTLNAAARFSEAGEPTLLSLHAPKVGFYASKGPSIDTKETQVGEEIARSTNDVSIADQSFVSAQGGNIDDESFATTYESADVAAKADKTNLSQSLLTRYTPIAGLVEHIAVVNDHAPRLAEDGLPLSGHAPSFPVNIVGWLGASLTGSLRIDAVDQMQREQWTEQQNRIKAATADADGSKADQRPSLGLGRGSFLGSVSGLDLGTYGPLSGGARNRFSPQAAASGAALRSPGSASSPRSPAA